MDYIVKQETSTQAEKRYFYLKNVKPVILKDALFADGTSEYVQINSKKARLRFRTGKNNVSQVYLWMGSQRYLMTKVESLGLFDYYQKEVDCPKEAISYYFEVTSGKLSLYYINIPKTCQWYVSSATKLKNKEGFIDGFSYLC